MITVADCLRISSISWEECRSVVVAMILEWSQLEYLFHKVWTEYWRWTNLAENLRILFLSAMVDGNVVNDGKGIHVIAWTFIVFHCFSYCSQNKSWGWGRCFNWNGPQPGFFPTRRVIKLHLSSLHQLHLQYYRCYVRPDLNQRISDTIHRTLSISFSSPGHNRRVYSVRGRALILLECKHTQMPLALWWRRIGQSIVDQLREWIEAYRLQGYLLPANPQDSTWHFPASTRKFLSRSSPVRPLWMLWFPLPWKGGSRCNLANTCPPRINVLHGLHHFLITMDVDKSLAMFLFEIARSLLISISSLKVVIWMCDCYIRRDYCETVHQYWLERLNTRSVDVLFKDICYTRLFIRGAKDFPWTLTIHSQFLLTTNRKCHPRITIKCLGSTSEQLYPTSRRLFAILRWSGTQIRILPIQRQLLRNSKPYEKHTKFCSMRIHTHNDRNQRHLIGPQHQKRHQQGPMRNLMRRARCLPTGIRSGRHQRLAEWYAAL